MAAAFGIQPGATDFLLILVEKEIGKYPVRGMLGRLAWLPEKHVEPQRMSPHFLSAVPSWRFDCSFST